MGDLSDPIFKSSNVRFAWGRGEGVEFRFDRRITKCVHHRQTFYNIDIILSSFGVSKSITSSAWARMIMGHSDDVS